jgi:hypothetical protein
MHKDGVTEEENSQKEDRYQGGNRRFGKCHIEWGAWGSVMIKVLRY